MTLLDPKLKRVFDLKLWLNEYEMDALEAEMQRTGEAKSVIAREFFAKQLQLEYEQKNSAQKQQA